MTSSSTRSNIYTTEYFYYFITGEMLLFATSKILWYLCF